MTLLIQQELHIPEAERAQFEERARTSTWPALLHFGAPMLAYGRWEFGGPSDRMVTNTAYADFDHWHATRADGTYHQDEAVLSEVRGVIGSNEIETELGGTVLTTRVFEVFDNVSPAQPFARRARQRLPEHPRSFGRGSVISERTLAINNGQREEFTRLSREIVWPWLEAQGGRLIGMGQDLMGPSNEVTTWFAFPSLSEWYRFARPSTANAPAEVANAYTARANVVQHQRGRILVVESDWGTGEGASA